MNNQTGSQWIVESEPDPPEAIIRDGDRVSWVEVTSVFPSDEYAHDAWSRVTPGEQRFDTSGRINKNMTANFADRFVRVVAAKRRKPSYLPYKQEHGPGSLLVDLHSPWFSDHTLEAMRERWAAMDWEGDLGCFLELFIVFSGRHGTEVARWDDCGS